MDNAVLPTKSAQPEPRSTIESNHLLRNPFAEGQIVQSESPNWQALEEYVGGNDVNPVDYYPTGPETTEHLRSVSSIPVPYSPMSQATRMHDAMPPHLNSSMYNSHCCYTSAYSILDSLRHVRHIHPASTKGSYNAVLLTAQSAIRDVSQLLKCPCSSDPHLAMLYSSITSKILTWYQTAAGVNPASQSSTSVSASLPWSGCQSLCSARPDFPPLSVPRTGEGENFNLYMQPSQHQHFDFEDLEQQRYKRRAILHELRGLGQLVQALANWRGKSPACEQAECLYDVLGGWLKSEIYKTVKSIESRDSQMI